MYETAIWRLSLLCWMVASMAGIAAAAPDTSGQPMPFEFGPDWRWAPPTERFPPQGRGRDAAEPGPLVPKRPERRPETLGPSEPPPSESALRGEALKRAMAPRPDPAVARQEKIDALFVRLAAEQDPEAAKRLAETLEIVWLQSGSATADLLMQRASAAMNSGQYQVARAILDKIVVLEPSWVEVWNRRAAVHSKLGDVDAAMADIDRVLKLEPRHFGALTAMGTILETAGFERRALEVFRRAFAIFPSQPLLQDHIERLEIAVEGRGI